MQSVRGGTRHTTWQYQIFGLCPRRRHDGVLRTIPTNRSVLHQCMQQLPHRLSRNGPGAEYQDADGRAILPPCNNDEHLLSRDHATKGGSLLSLGTLSTNEAPTPLMAAPLYGLKGASLYDSSVHGMMHTSCSGWLHPSAKLKNTYANCTRLQNNTDKLDALPGACSRQKTWLGSISGVCMSGLTSMIFFTVVRRRAAMRASVSPGCTLYVDPMTTGRNERRIISCRSFMHNRQDEVREQHMYSKTIHMLDDYEHTCAQSLPYSSSKRVCTHPPASMGIPDQ